MITQFIAGLLYEAALEVSGFSLDERKSIAMVKYTTVCLDIARQDLLSVLFS